MIKITIICDICGFKQEEIALEPLRQWKEIDKDKHICPSCVDKWAKKQLTYSDQYGIIQLESEKGVRNHGKTN